MLPANSEIKVTIGPGVPSAEGSSTSQSVSSVTFTTFGALKVDKYSCDYKSRCTPDDTIILSFNNYLDTEDFDVSKITTEPKVENLSAAVYGDKIHIDGPFKPNTRLQLKLDRSLKDIYGQTLERDVTLSFNVSLSEPQLSPTGMDFAVLDPFGPTRYSVYSQNFGRLRLRLYQVTAEDWPKWIAYRAAIDDGASRNRLTPPGRLVSSRYIQVHSKPDEWFETSIDLKDAFKDGLGHAIVIVEPSQAMSPRSNAEPEVIETWLQRTNIGLDAFIDDYSLVGWATSLKDGRPLERVQMTLLPYQVAGVTNATGFARLGLKPKLANEPLSFLVARQGNDVAILPEKPEYYDASGYWYRSDPSNKLAWYVFDDRGLYKPGENVNVKGWLRQIGGGIQGDVNLVSGMVKRVNYVVTDAQHVKLANGTADVNLYGGFDFQLQLPTSTNLGDATIQLTPVESVDGFHQSTFHRTFRVAEFRRPEFEVNTKNNSEGPLLVGHHADLNVTAKYYSGGGLPNAEIAWRVTSKPASFTPPNRGDFTFGEWTPWWTSESSDGASTSQTLTGRTNSLGVHNLRIDFDGVKPAKPYSVNAEAVVTDVNRQRWASNTTMLVHPASVYVGVKSDQTFVDQGTPLVVQAIVTDLDGVAVPGREIHMRAVIRDWKQVKGEWQEVETEVSECLTRSGLEVTRCTFETKRGGSYRVIATVRDEQERINESKLSLWVAGRDSAPDRGIGADEVELIPSRENYRPGDVAEILVRAPFWPAEGVMVLARSGIVKTEHFRVDSPSHTLKVAIDESWTPNINVAVLLTGVADREDEYKQAGAPQKRPAFASGELNLPIPPNNRKLDVNVVPKNKALEPGTETVVAVQAKDASGRAVANSEVAVAVVDESVLALTDYRLADPLSVFYQKRDSETVSHHLRQNIVLSMQSLEFAASGGVAGGGGPGGGVRAINGFWAVSLPNAPPPAMLARGGVVADTIGSGEQPPPIRVRQNFGALAVFVPAVRTDSNGNAEVKFKLPDSLTRYRVMAVAVAGEKQFGLGESSITARMPMTVRPSAPRFLNLGDSFEFPVVIHNQTENVMTVDVAMRANPDLSFNTARSASQQQWSAGRRVTVEPNDRVEVRFPGRAEQTGVARVQIAAASKDVADAAELSIPVLTPGSTEFFATYGEIDQGAISQPVKAPPAVFKGFGGLEVETSSTQLQQLTDAFLYLQQYPYECAEQLASRIISIAALRDVLMSFKAEGVPTPEEVDAAIARDLKKLRSMQNDDGGFGFWKRGDKAWPFLSVHVAHALARAQQNKFAVPPEMLEKSKKYLREIEHKFPSEYGVDAQWAIRAYALYVRAQMGDRDISRARKLIGNGDVKYLSLETNGWILSVLGDDKSAVVEREAIRRLFNNRAVETAGQASFAASYGDDAHVMLHSNRRTDGIILEALISDQPNNPLIPKLVRGLLGHRTRGRWANTQENVFILLALNRYFNTYEKVTPEFVARVWLGNGYAGEQQFQGRSVDRQQVNVPMNYLAAKMIDRAQDLVISKEGPGRLYYRVAMNYAPEDLSSPAADYGFAVERTYEAIDHADDVRRDANGNWLIKAGARVRVRLTMASPSRRNHVALVDPLPAGFELLNPELAVMEKVPDDPKKEGVMSYGSRSFGQGWWLWRPTWFDHQNLRDDRAEAFASLLWEGVYDYSYVARATTPGMFVVPSAKAEEMYHPETFGRSRTDRVKIE